MTNEELHEAMVLQNSAINLILSTLQAIVHGDPFTDRFRETP